MNWTKIPEDGFYGGVDDFRDPHVVWVEEENRYWMLVSTWRGQGDWTAVLKLYTSSDLKTWEYGGVYYDDAVNGDFMECPTLLRYNGYWYLSYFQKAVDGTNARVTRYVYKKNLSDEWIRPETDCFDGAGLSAARLVQCGDRLITVGWIGTKISDYDAGQFTWAGNLALHELKQRADGTLYVARAGAGRSARARNGVRDCLQGRRRRISKRQRAVCKVAALSISSVRTRQKGRVETGFYAGSRR